MQLDKGLPCRISRAVFAVFMAWVWCGGADMARADHVHPASRPANPEQTKLRLEQAFRAIEAAAADVPRETFDLPAVAASIGPDPAAALTWMREHTAWMPYRGSLRGPLGVLMDRHGNSLDRATLLAELLRVGGKTVRLAHGQLPDDVAKKLFSETKFEPPKPLTTTPPPRRGDIDQLAQKYIGPAGLDVADFRRYAEDGLAKSEQLTADIMQRTKDQSAKLAEWVWPGGAAAPQAAAGPTPEALAALADHWWVQCQDGQKWVDLDPAPLQVESRPKIPEFIDWQPKDSRWPLGGNLCHEIDLRLTVEQWDGTQLNEHPVLQETIRPSEVIGQYINISYFAVNGPTELNLDKEPDPAARLKQLALDVHEWVPILRVGQRRLYQGSFSDSGAANPKPDLMAMAQQGKAAGGGAMKMGGLLGGIGGPPPAPAANGTLTALWLDYHLRSPGLPPRRIRRQIFDVLGPAARAGIPAMHVDLTATARLNRNLVLLGQTEILPLACQLSPHFVSDLSSNSVLKMREALTTVFTSDDEAALTRAAETIGRLPPVPGQLYHVALGRRLFNPSAAYMLMDRPNVLSAHHFTRDDGSRGLLYCVATDIVANEMGVRIGGGPEAQRACLLQGVLDTNAEALLADPDARLGNTADLLHGNPDSKQWLLVRKADDADWKQAQVPQDARLRVEADLAQGYVVVIPRTAAVSARQSFGWWRIDPATGQTLGMGDQGWGSEVTEEHINLAMMGHYGCIAGNMGKNLLKGSKQYPSPSTSVVCALASLGTAITFTTITQAVVNGFLLASIAAGAGQ